MFDRKRMNQVVVCVDEYKKRKKIFHKFRDSCTEILSQDNPFDMSIQSIGETRLEFVVFDTRIVADFSFKIRTAKDTEELVTIGYIAFKSVAGDAAEEFWELYFDKNGHVAKAVGGETYPFNILNTHGVENFLYYLVFKFINLDCYKAKEKKGLFFKG